jgi:hypothetical protein
MNLNEWADFLIYDLALIAGSVIVITAWILIGMLLIITSIHKTKD